MNVLSFPFEFEPIEARISTYSTLLPSNNNNKYIHRTIYGIFHISFEYLLTSFLQNLFLYETMCNFVHYVICVLHNQFLYVFLIKIVCFVIPH
jgi:predicted neutral ceramidase superfamily lipid hydrolase